MFIAGTVLFDGRSTLNAPGCTPLVILVEPVHFHVCVHGSYSGFTTCVPCCVCLVSEVVVAMTRTNWLGVGVCVCVFLWLHGLQLVTCTPTVY